MKNKIHKYDFLIVGAGMIGCLTALSLLKKKFKILVIDKEDLRIDDSRTLAVNAKSRDFLKNLNLWNGIKKTQPIKNIFIKDYINTKELIFENKEEDMGTVIYNKEILFKTRKILLNKNILYKNTNVSILDILDSKKLIVSAFVVSLFIVGGETVLGFIGISMPAFRIAGGILLFLTALDMLFQRRSKRRENQTEQELVDDPSVFPLAIPLIIGPGAIATVILIAGAKPGLVGIASTGFITALVLLTVFVFFSTASRIEKLLGKTGIDVLTRLLGMLLAALSVQFVIKGLVEFFPKI